MKPWEQYQTAELRPFQPGEQVDNNDGTFSTERTVTVPLGGRWANVPSLWMAPEGPRQLSEDQAIGAAERYMASTGEAFPMFDTVDEAVAQAEQRSAAGGAGQGMITQASNDLPPWEQFAQQQGQRAGLQTVGMPPASNPETAPAPSFNMARGAVERGGDLLGGLFEAGNALAEKGEESYPLGGLVWEGGLIPDYKGPEEYAKWRAEQGGDEPLKLAAEHWNNTDAGYVENHTWERVKQEFSEGGALSGSAWAEVMAYGAEQGVKSIPDMVAAMVALPSYITARSGEIGAERAKNKGKAETELVDVLEAAPAAIGSAILERIGAKGITEAGAEALGKEALKHGFAKMAREGAKAGGKEAGTEFLQEGIIEYLGERLGTGADMSFGEAMDRGAAGAVAGGVYGTGAGTAGAAVNQSRSQDTQASSDAAPSIPQDEAPQPAQDQAAPTLQPTDDNAPVNDYEGRPEWATDRTNIFRDGVEPQAEQAAPEPQPEAQPEPVAEQPIAATATPTESGQAADDLSPYERNQLRDAGVTDEQLWDMPTDEARQQLNEVQRAPVVTPVAEAEAPAVAPEAQNETAEQFLGEPDAETVEAVEAAQAEVAPEPATQVEQEAPVAAEPDAAAEIDVAAAETDTNPTEAQKEAGNYRKAKVRVHGLEIAIENPRGSTRSGTDPNGQKWESVMAHHYGDIKGTKAADGDNLDVFIGPDVDSDRVFIIDQVNADGTFDEHKILLGFRNQAAARKGYRDNYDKGWKVGPTTRMSVDEFKTWLKDGDTTKPVQAEKVKQPEKVTWTKDGNRLWRGSNGMIIADLSMSVGGSRAKLFAVFKNKDARDKGDNFTSGKTLMEAKKNALSAPKTTDPQGTAKDSKAILTVFRELGRENPTVEYGALSARNNGIAKRIEEAVGRKLTVEQIREAVSQKQKEAAYQEGQNSETTSKKEQTDNLSTRVGSSERASSQAPVGGTGESDGINGTKDRTVTPPTKQVILSAFRKVGEANPVGSLSGSSINVQDFIKAEVGREVKGKELSDLVTGEEITAAYEEGQKAAIPGPASQPTARPKRRAGKPELHDMLDELAEQAKALPIPVAASDVPYDSAYNAYRGISHSPDDRALQEQIEYMQEMIGLHDNMSKLANTDEKKSDLASELARYKRGYLQKNDAVLAAKSRTMSSMIAGGSNFPVARNKKRLDAESRRMDEFMEWREKARKSIRKTLSPETQAISSTDSDALTKLQTKLQNLEAVQERMKTANKIVRDSKLSDDAKVSRLKDEAKLSETQAKELLEPDFAGRLGFPSYSLSNNNAEIRRIKQRIQDLEARQEKAEAVGGAVSVEFEGGRVEVDYESGFIRVQHDEKPSAEVRQALKSGGFRWAPSETAWRRKISNQAIWKAEQITGANMSSVAEASFSRVEVEGAGYLRDTTVSDSAKTPSRGKNDSRQATVAGSQPGIKKADAQAHVNRITANWKGKPDVVVVDNTSELPGGLFLNMVVAGNPETVRAAVWADKVYVIAPRVASTQVLEKVILHEVIGHHGLRKVLGPELKPALNQVYQKLGKTEQAEQIKQTYFPGNSFDPTKTDHRHTVAEELIAHIAETNEHQSLWAKVVAAIRAGLRRLGFTLDLTKNDVLSLLRGAQRVVEQGGYELESDGALAAVAASRFSRAQHGIPDAEVDAFSGFLSRYESGQAKQGEEFEFDSTPAILKALGAGDHRLVISAGVVSKAVDLKHDLSLDALRELPNQLADPVMVFDSQTSPDGLVVLTELTDNRGKPVVVAVHMNRKGRRATINRIASVHAKESAGQIESWIGKGLLAYRNKKKARSWPQVRPLQLRWEGVKNALREKVLTEKDVFVKSPEGDVRFSRTPDLDPQPFGTASDTLVRMAVSWIADKFTVLKGIQQNIEATQGEIAENANAYQAEELFHGKVENDLRLLRENMIEPMAKKMSEYGVSLAQLDEFLYAMHAPERNRVIAQRDPKLPDGGSGMTNAEAAAIINKVDQAGKLGQYKELAAQVHAMLAKRREILNQNGLLDDETLGAWEETYRFYVPLKGHAADEKQASLPRTGKGFAISGPESKMAAGRKSKAASPVANAVNDLTEAVLRHRKNEVGNAFLRLVHNHPNPDLWRIYTADNPEVERKAVKVKDPATGKTKIEVRETVVPMAMMQDRYFTTKVNGNTYYIKVEDPRLMKAMKNIGPDNTGLLVRSLSAVTRLMSSLNTSYNPEFVVSNFSRDIQTALMNLSSEQSAEGGKARGKAIVAKTLKDVPFAIRAINASLKGDKALTGRAGEYQRYFDEFRADGAKTGWFDMKDVDGQMADLETMIKMASGGFANRSRRAFNAVTDWVEHTNAAIENGVRLAAYVNAREAKISRAQAASLAKNMTVNFNRRGELGTTLNALYMFANASIQGTANFVRTLGRLNGKKGDRIWRRLNTAQKIAAGMAVGGFTLSLLNRLVAGEDDDGESWWDKVPDYVKERNIVIMDSLWGGEPGKYTTIPLPYGYNIFPLTGLSLEHLIFSDKSAGQIATNLTLGALGSFSPIGFEDSDELHGLIGKNVAPTVLKPVVSIGLNENFMGGPLYKENFSFGTPKPDSALAFRSTAQVYKELAKGLNEVTGGSEFRSGAVDLSPDVMDYLVGYYGGGAYDFFTSRVPNFGTKLVQGVELEDREVPFKRKVRGEVLPYEDQSKFYDRRDEINQLTDERDALTGAERVRFIRDYGDKLRLDSVVKASERRLKLLRKKRDRIELRDDLSAAEKDAKLQEVEQQMKQVFDRFNRRYNALDD